MGNRMTLSELKKWDRRFLSLADHIAGWSKGPRKRVGAVIVRPDRSVASMGYNGPPRGYDDEAFLAMTRGEQHEVVIHAEHNALMQMSLNEYSQMRKGDEYTIYISPLYPCEVCAEKIVDSGVSRVVAYCGHTSDDWAESARKGEELFKSNGVEYIFVREGET